jgi:hypothetical protein
MGVIMLIVQTQDTTYTLADFGEALETIDIFTGEVCQVDVKEFSPFEQSVYQFLTSNKE